MTRIGKLRHRLRLERPVRVSDGTGGAEVTWQPVAAVWAAVEPVRFENGVKAEKISAAVTHRITIRYRDDVSTDMRLIAGTRIFEIDSVRDDAERRRHLTCLVRERLTP
ncbi:phage head closure protein [Rhodoligotrophos defluvii]|uniref:phage head closure protein n=1 Tax=Rhodoligotrophos defluvii TaxID=2561934 RepID=UPI00148583B0|nr:phage head closure protein [Rhodoligotrophos defluvii]